MSKYLSVTAEGQLTNTELWPPSEDKLRKINEAVVFTLLSSSLTELSPLRKDYTQITVGARLLNTNATHKKPLQNTNLIKF